MIHAKCLFKLFDVAQTAVAAIAAPRITKNSNRKPLCAQREKFKIIEKEKTKTKKDGKKHNGPKNWCTTLPNFVYIALHNFDPVHSVSLGSAGGRYIFSLGERLPSSPRMLAAEERREKMCRRAQYVNAESNLSLTHLSSPIKYRNCVSAEMLRRHCSFADRH